MKKSFQVLKKMASLLASFSLLSQFLSIPILAESNAVTHITPVGLDGSIQSTAQIDSATGQILSLDLIANNIPENFQQSSFSNPFYLDLGLNPITQEPIELNGSLNYDQSIPITWSTAGTNQNQPLAIALPVSEESVGPETVMISRQAKTVWSDQMDQSYINWNSRIEGNYLILPWSLIPVASFRICSNAKNYVDEASIPEYGKEAVRLLGARGIMTGTESGETFSPFDPLTRAQASVILYRLFGRDYLARPLENLRNPTWYSQAREYLLYQKIMGNGSDFAPDQFITREQLALILQRIEAGRPSEIQALLDSYPDGGQVSGWAKEGMAYCIEHNLMGQGSLLDPKKALSRVDTATIISRFLEKIYDCNENRQGRLQQIYALRNQFLAEMNGIAKPEDVDQPVFDDWKNKAINPEIDGFLNQAQHSPFSTALYLEVNAIQSFDNDYSRLMRVLPLMPKGYLKAFTEDFDLYDFILNYPDRESYLPAASHTQASFITVPHYLQWDLRWGYQPYGDSIIGYAGCAPTCMSMVLSYLLKDDSITPGRLAQEAMDQGQYCPGVGTYHSIFPVLSRNYGIACQKINVDTPTINHQLEMGHPVILNMGPGIFTHGGHFIVVVGAEQGKWRVNDPFSIKRTTLWDPGVVIDNCYNQLSGAKNGWAFWR